MPRVSRQQTSDNRAAIETAAARLFREQGFHGISVAGLMAAAGLTHGGFYGHFASKDALIACACGKAFERSSRRWDERIAEQASPAAALASLVDAYLSTAGQGMAGKGCPAAGLAADVAREAPDAPVRRAYGAGVQGLVGQLASLSGAADEAGRQREGMQQLSMLAGALMLARATDGSALSEQLLDAARQFLLVPAA